MDEKLQHWLRHLPYYLIDDENWATLEVTLLNLPFLEQKAEQNMVIQLADDFSAAVAAMPIDRPMRRILRLIEEAIRRDLYFLIRHPTTLFQCLWNCCWWHDAPEATKHYQNLVCSSTPNNANTKSSEPKLYKIMEEFRKKREANRPGSCWLRSLRPPSASLDTNQVSILTGHNDVVWSTCFSSDGLHIVSAGTDDETVRIWDVRKGIEVQKIEAGGRVLGSAFSSINSRLLAWAAGRNVHIGMMGSKHHAVLKGHTDLLICVSFAADESLLVSGGKDGTVRVWDIKENIETACLSDHKAFVWCVAVSEDKQYIASGTDEGVLWIWDRQKRTVVHRIAAHKKYVRSIAFAPDSRRIVSGGGDNNVKIWNAVSGLLEDSLEGHTDIVRSVKYSPKGDMIASASWDRTVRVWNARSKELYLRLSGHDGQAESVCFSPNEKFIASSGQDQTIRVWSIVGNGSERSLFNHNGFVRDIRFSPDGKHLASTSEGEGLFLWDVATGLSLGRIGGWDGFDCDRVAFDPANRLRAMIEGARWEIVASENKLETTIVDTTTKKACAWFPRHWHNHRQHPSGNTWAISFGNHIALFTIEGTESAQTNLEVGQELLRTT